MRNLILAIFIELSSFSAQNELSDVRGRFAAAVDDRNLLRSFVASTDRSNMPEAAGYRALAVLMLAEESFNPLAKMRYFIMGRDSLEALISRDPMNAELRLMRLSVQRKVPLVLGYSSDAKSDIVFLRACFPTLTDKGLKALIAGYFLDQNIHLKS